MSYIKLPYNAPCPVISSVDIKSVCITSDVLSDIHSTLWWSEIAVKGLAKDWTSMIWLLMGEFGFFFCVMSRFILSVQLGTRMVSSLTSILWILFLGLLHAFVVRCIMKGITWHFMCSVLLNTLVSSWPFCSLVRRKLHNSTGCHCGLFSQW